MAGKRSLKIQRFWIGIIVLAVLLVLGILTMLLFSRIHHPMAQQLRESAAAARAAAEAARAAAEAARAATAAAQAAAQVAAAASSILGANAPSAGEKEGN